MSFVNVALLLVGVFLIALGASWISVASTTAAVIIGVALVAGVVIDQVR